MVIRLSPEAKAQVRELMKRGGYEESQGGGRGGIEDSGEKAWYVQLKAAIAVGFEHYRRGESITWTPDSFDWLRREATSLARIGTPIEDEVIP